MAKSPANAQDFANSIAHPQGNDPIGAANAAGYDVNIHTIPNGNSVTQIVTVKNPATGETGVFATSRPSTVHPDDPYTRGESSVDFPAESPNDDYPAEPPPRPDPNEPPDYGMEPEESNDFPEDDTFALPDEESSDFPEDDTFALPDEEDPELPPEDSDIPPEDQTPAEDEDAPGEEEPPPEEGDAQEGCSYCVPAPDGGLLSGVPIIGDIVDGIQNGLHLITHGLHEGNIWKVINGAFQLYDAASDILMLKNIVQKLSQKAFKEAFKRAMEELIQRKQEELGLDPDEAMAEVLTEMLETQFGDMPEDQREAVKNILETLLGLDGDKNDGRPSDSDTNSPSNDSGNPSEAGDAPSNPDSPPASDGATPPLSNNEGDQPPRKPDGPPLGAENGNARGRRLLETQKEPGHPDLPARDATTFRSAEPDFIPPGTKLYRVQGSPAGPNGRYYTTTPPKDLEQFRRDYAVREDWNSATEIQEITVGSEGLRVWRGPAASQNVSDTPTGYHYPGGGEQIWIPPSESSFTITDKYPTNW